MSKTEKRKPFAIYVTEDELEIIDRARALGRVRVNRSPWIVAAALEFAAVELEAAGKAADG